MATILNYNNSSFELLLIIILLAWMVALLIRTVNAYRIHRSRRQPLAECIECGDTLFEGEFIHWTDHSFGVCEDCFGFDCEWCADRGLDQCWCDEDDRQVHKLLLAGDYKGDPNTPCPWAGCEGGH